MLVLSETFYLTFYEAPSKDIFSRSRRHPGHFHTVYIISPQEVPRKRPTLGAKDDQCESWLGIQGREFTSEQMEWLEMIKNHIATSLELAEDDFDYTSFQERGGLLRARQVFGDELDDIMDDIMDELNGALTL